MYISTLYFGIIIFKIILLFKSHDNNLFLLHNGVHFYEYT